MHELPVMESILSIVLKHAQGCQAQQIVSITLHMGEMSDLEPEWMQHFFDFLSRDTIAQQAELRVVKIPIELKCPDCGALFTVTRETLAEAVCPECSCSSRFTMESGREYFVKEMEVV